MLECVELSEEVFMNSHSLKDAAIEFLTLVGSGRVSEAYERHIAAGSRHQNPYERNQEPQ